MAADVLADLPDYARQILGDGERLFGGGWIRPACPACEIAQRSRLGCCFLAELGEGRDGRVSAAYVGDEQVSEEDLERGGGHGCKV